MDANVHQRAVFAPNSLSPFCQAALVKEELPAQFKYYIRLQPQKLTNFCKAKLNFSIPQFDALDPNVPLNASGLPASSR